jgi:mannitol-1-phosphate 5-dehydrogenase
MKAVHFGAGNIGRGFVGLLLHQGGYDVVFSDVAGPLVDAINAVDRYTVHEVGDGGTDVEVTGFRAINSAENPQAVIDEIATADVVTTAVGPNILRFVAPVLVEGLRARSADLPALQVMACENAIGATDTLRTLVTENADADWAALSDRAVFANTAVDRIVPGQPEGIGVDVVVEPYFEWAIESGPFGDRRPAIPGAHFVSDLGPYIERKLFTVNTGHAATAYFGARDGVERISDALAVPEIAQAVSATLAETSAALIAKHAFAPDDLARYRETIIGRFRNPELPDTVWRVGRQPLRKLSRHERFIGPAAEAAERGLSVTALVTTVAAALEFAHAEDPEAVELQRLLRELDASAFTAQVTGLEPQHPLFAPVEAVVATRQAAL